MSIVTFNPGGSYGAGPIQHSKFSIQNFSPTQVAPTEPNHNIGKLSINTALPWSEMHFLMLGDVEPG
jgi:hypothetical protein